MDNQPSDHDRPLFETKSIKFRGDQWVLIFIVLIICITLYFISREISAGAAGLAFVYQIVASLRNKGKTSAEIGAGE